MKNSLSQTNPEKGIFKEKEKYEKFEISWDKTAK